MTRSDLQQLAELRLREAQKLLEAGEPSGAYYLAGYAVECALKACIAKQTQQYEFPDKTRATQSYTHKLKVLLEIADLDQALSFQSKMDHIFNRYWAIVLSWSEESRYGVLQLEKAQGLIDAVADAQHGVLSWLRTHW